ncbi:ParA family protein [Parasediminibacterium sp. JCM 36343]|uniref:ParA family protein n=1 Tax=Parasediminibacterium sp. JCM 36343 TaxID=3374279 RepID=UPI0039784763
MVALAFYNLKGGVGKTTSAINLAYLAAQEGYKTLLWDLDPQGSASFYLGVSTAVKNETKKVLNSDIDLLTTIQPSAYKNLSVIPADLSARQADVLLSEGKQSKKRLGTLLASLKKGFDLVIIDSPPGISLLHDNVFNAADWVLMPNVPTTLSIRSYETVISYFEAQEFKKEKIKCFFSMVDSRKNLHQATINHYQHNNSFLKNYIPYLSDVEKMGINEAPLETFAKGSPAAQCYRELWAEIKKVCL